MEQNRNPAKGEGAGKQKGNIISGIVGLCAFLLIVFCMDHALIFVYTSLGGIGKGKVACETAELAVQSKVIGDTWPMESKVIYKNDDYKVVAVKYWIPGGSGNSYWVTFVLCSRSGESWYYLIKDVTGVDYDHISKDTIKELRLGWELK